MGRHESRELTGDDNIEGEEEHSDDAVGDLGHIRYEGPDLRVLVVDGEDAVLHELHLLGLRAASQLVDVLEPISSQFKLTSAARDILFNYFKN